MYKAFFGLTDNPFNLSPDPAFLYRSPQHEEALANLIYGVQSRKGFIVLTGEVGTGKTTMLECLRDHLSAQQIPFAVLFNSRLTPDQLFEMISYDFGFGVDRPTKTQVLFQLNAMLLEQAAAGRTAVLIVDEAQNLSWDSLEEIRLLGNLENRRGKLLQIILAGQPELDQKLEEKEYRQLKQRITLRCRLRAFTLPETEEYIASRLRHAGMQEQTVFPSKVLEGIQARTGGIPRLINSVCDNLLLTAFALETKVVTMEILEEVAEDLQLRLPPEPKPAATPQLPVLETEAEQPEQSSEMQEVVANTAPESGEPVVTEEVVQTALEDPIIQPEAVETEGQGSEKQEEAAEREPESAEPSMTRDVVETAFEDPTVQPETPEKEEAAAREHGEPIVTTPIAEQTAVEPAAEPIAPTPVEPEIVAAAPAPAQEAPAAEQEQKPETYSDPPPQTATLEPKRVFSSWRFGKHVWSDRFRRKN